jgi:hypothetical protein
MNEQNTGQITSALRTVLGQMTASTISVYYKWMPFAMNDSLTKFFSRYQREHHFVFCILMV